MPCAIHVPRGCTGRIARNTAVLEISGLYSEGIDHNCAVIVCASDDKASLTFADSNTSAGVAEEEIDWTGDGNATCMLLKVFVKGPSSRAVAESAIGSNLELFQVHDLLPEDDGIFATLRQGEKGGDWQAGVLSFGKGCFEVHCSFGLRTLSWVVANGCPYESRTADLDHAIHRALLQTQSPVL